MPHKNISFSEYLFCMAVGKINNIKPKIMKDKVLKIITISIIILIFLNIGLQSNASISKLILVFIVLLALWGVIYLFVNTFYNKKFVLDIYIFFRPVFGIVLLRMSNHSSDVNENIKYSVFWYSIFLFSYGFIIIKYLFDLIKKSLKKNYN